MNVYQCADITGKHNDGYIREIYPSLEFYKKFKSTRNYCENNSSDNDVKDELTKHRQSRKS